jgi:hypothetical protein
MTSPPSPLHRSHVHQFPKRSSDGEGRGTGSVVIRYI